MKQEAAAKNFSVFKQYRFVLGWAIEAQKFSPLGYGSEFKKPRILQQIFKTHLLWARMECLLIEGSQWPLKEISKSDRVADLQEALQFRNHKSATSKHHPTPTSLPTRPMALSNMSHPAKWLMPSVIPYAPLASTPVNLQGRNRQIGRCNGYVPGQMPGVHNHAHWPMVKQPLHLVYQKTSHGVQPQPIQENADLPELPPCTKLWPSGVRKWPLHTQWPKQCWDKEEC